MKFCPECGEKIESHQKFCPNCGFKINMENRQSEKLEKQSGEVIACPVCGEENEASAALCESCGAKLSGGKKSSGVKKTVEQSRVKKTAAQPKVVEKENREQLDKTKVIYVAVGILAMLLLVLYTSGVFDTVPAPSGTPQINQNTDQGVSSGVNLANVQKINELETRLKNEPGNTELLLEIAHLKNDSGLFEQAIIDYKKYLEINPKNADARIDMGVCYYNLRQYEPAMAEMKQALEYSPDHQIGHLNLGIVNLAAGNLEESKKWLSKAVSINPNSEIGKKAQELLQSH